MDVPCPAKHPPCALPSKYRFAPPASTVEPSTILQDTDLSYFLPGISDGICVGADFAPLELEPQSWPWMNMPCTLLLSDSTRDTPVVMSTLRRSPLSTFLHWVSTTPPAMVIRLARVSKIAVSPVTTWSFCVTTTEPLASSRRIDELPPGPGVVDCIGPDFDPFGAAGGGVAGAGAGPES